MRKTDALKHCIIIHYCPVHHWYDSALIWNSVRQRSVNCKPLYQSGRLTLSYIWLQFNTVSFNTDISWSYSGMKCQEMIVQYHACSWRYALIKPYIVLAELRALTNAYQIYQPIPCPRQKPDVVAIIFKLLTLVYYGS